MADESNRISSSQVGSAGIDLIRQAMGAAPRAKSAASLGGQADLGPRGQRMLAPDTPLDRLDRSAPRGTYLDILV